MDKNLECLEKVNYSVLNLKLDELTGVQTSFVDYYNNKKYLNLKKKILQSKRLISDKFIS